MSICTMDSVRMCVIFVDSNIFLLCYIITWLMDIWKINVYNLTALHIRCLQ